MHSDPTISLFSEAVAAFCEGNQVGASAALASIDYEGLVARRSAERDFVWGPEGVGRKYRQAQSAKRQPTKTADVRATHTRDRHTCRYFHCRRPTIALDVLKLMSKAFPDALPYHSNWKPVERHILYWVYSTSLEHHVPFGAGGTSEAANLLTACYLCNDVKNYLPAEIIGWTVADPPESEWSGLSEYLPALRKAVGTLAPPLPGT